MLHDPNHNVGLGPFVYKKTYLAFTSISGPLFNHRGLKFDPSITPIASKPKAHNVIRNDINMRFSVFNAVVYMA